ncbi:hypothetical protein B484DRAFT_482179, partial [Ochromonadaceae sp. CCMP2298]
MSSLKAQVSKDKDMDSEHSEAEADADVAYEGGEGHDEGEEQTVDGAYSDADYDDERKDDTAWEAAGARLERELSDDDEDEPLSILPTAPLCDCAAEPHLLIGNAALSHFWGHYFPQQTHVLWFSFLDRMEIHLSAPRDEGSTGYPSSPSGYGLHSLELLTLFRERPGKRHLMRSLKYALDMENTHMVSVYQLALLVRTVPAMPLKLLVYYLANMGGRVLLPMCPTDAVSVGVRASFRMAVLAERDYAAQLQQVEGGEGEGVPVAELFSPYADACAHLQGPDSLREWTERFLGEAREKGGFYVVAAPSGQGATTRVVAAVKAQLHRALERSHALVRVAAQQGSISVWDLGSEIKSGVEAKDNFYSSGPKGTKSPLEPVYSSADVADDSFAFSGLFDALYVDLRGRSSRGDVLSAFSCQLALSGDSLSGILACVEKFLRSLRKGSVLVLDHVQRRCAVSVRQLFSSMLDGVSVVVIPQLQSASPIMSLAVKGATVPKTPHLFNSYSDLGSLSEPGEGQPGPKGRPSELQRYYGAGGSRRSTWEEEEAGRCAEGFLEELRGFLQALGVRWGVPAGPKWVVTVDEGQVVEVEVGLLAQGADRGLSIPPNLLVLTYSLSRAETEAAVRMMWGEIRAK